MAVPSCCRSQVPKKPSAGVFSLDSEHALVADKFGDVTAAATDGGQPAQLLGHYCSAITAMAVSPKGRSPCDDSAELNVQATT